MNYRDLTKIFYDKEPDVHEFFIDFKRGIFYKCYQHQYRERYEHELSMFKLLQGPNVPKLIESEVNNNFCVIGTEFIPYPSIYSFTRECTPAEKSTFTVEEKQLIKNQVQSFLNKMRDTGVIIGDTIHVDFNPSSFIFDRTRKLLYFTDFDKFSHSLSAAIFYVNRAIDNLPEGVIGGVSIDEEWVRRYWTCPEKYFTEQNWQDCESFRTSIVHSDHSYQPVFINGKLSYGLVPPSYERSIIYEMDYKDFLGKKVVDIGCNIGSFLIWAADRGARHVVGLENAPHFYNNCKTYINLMKQYYNLPPYIYNNIEVLDSDALRYDYSDADTILYLSCWGGLGSPEFHAKLGQNAQTIYFSGHGDGEQEKIDMEKVLYEFGDFEWKFTGYMDQTFTERGSPRPHFRGVRK